MRLCAHVVGVIEHELVLRTLLPQHRADHYTQLSSEGLYLELDGKGDVRELKVHAHAIGQVPHRNCLRPFPKRITGTEGIGPLMSY